MSYTVTNVTNIRQDDQIQMVSTRSGKSSTEETGLLVLLKPLLLVLTSVSVIIAVFNAAPILYMREVYGPVMNSRSEDLLFWVTLLLAFALMLTGFSEWVRSRYLSSLSVSFFTAVSKRVFEATFRANLQGAPAANLALSDLKTVKSSLASPLLGLMLEAPVGLLLLIFVYLIHPYMGLMASLGAVLTVILMFFTERAVAPLIEESTKLSNRSQRTMTNLYRGKNTAHVMGMLPGMYETWATQQRDFLRAQAEASNRQGMGSALAKVVMLVQGSAVLGVGTLLTLMGFLSMSEAGLLIVAKFLGGLAIQPVMRLIQSSRSLLSGWESYKRLTEFLEAVPANPTRMSLPRPKGYLTVQNLIVRAPRTKTPILQGLTFQVEPGQMLAVLGNSGSGKTTLVKTLCGLMPAVSGDARLDGADLYRWDKAELGPYIGYLPQNIALFDGTLAHNIARFELPDDEKVKSAISLAGLDDLVTALPMGIHTEIGDSGMILSGGQRQRVGLARAVYGNPQLIVLDEPNSNLDQAGDLALTLTLQKLKERGVTVILVTHRREVLAITDLVLILSVGRQVDFGSPQKVFARLKQRSERDTQALAKPT